MGGQGLEFRVLEDLCVRVSELRPFCLEYGIRGFTGFSKRREDPHKAIARVRERTAGKPRLCQDRV